MKFNILFLVSAFTISSCSSSSSSDLILNDSTEEFDQEASLSSQEVTPIEFEGRWILTSYTLDDGTIRTVPDSIVNEGGIGIEFSSGATMAVLYDYCGFYQISYVLEHDVLTTSNPVSPEAICFALYGDVNSAERSELMRLTFLSSQTLITLSINVLTVTSVQNETLRFVRSDL